MRLSDTALVEQLTLRLRALQAFELYALVLGPHEVRVVVRGFDRIGELVRVVRVASTLVGALLAVIAELERAAANAEPKHVAAKAEPSWRVQDRAVKRQRQRHKDKRARQLRAPATSTEASRG